MCLVYARAITACRAETAAAEDARARGDLAAAVEGYDRALHWYAPGNPFLEPAAVALWEIGEARDRAGEKRAALDAYGRLRSAILSTRGLYQPMGTWVERAEERIAGLMTEEEISGSGSPAAPADRDAIRAWHRERLSRRDDPRRGWSLAAVAGFLGWMAAMLAFVFRAFDRDGRLVPAGALRWGPPVALFFTLWMVGLVSA